MEGINSEIVKRIWKQPELQKIFMEYATATPEDQKYFEITEEADGKIKIVNRKPELIKKAREKAAIA